jgi:3-hydroxybutyryl-CoA dehydrogenase
MKLGVVTERPEKVIGIHFFNPVPVLQLVELVPSLLTTPDVTAQARTFVESQLGKKAIDSQDRAGFVVNGVGVERAQLRPIGCNQLVGDAGLQCRTLLIW